MLKAILFILLLTPFLSSSQSIGDACSIDSDCYNYNFAACVDLNADGISECHCGTGYVETTGPTCDDAGSGDITTLICCPPAAVNKK